jgi:hypothetical protein
MFEDKIMCNNTVWSPIALRDVSVGTKVRKQPRGKTYIARESIATYTVVSSVEKSTTFLRDLETDTYGLVRVDGACINILPGSTIVYVRAKSEDVTEVDSDSEEFLSADHERCDFAYEDLVEDEGYMDSDCHPEIA